MHWLGAVERLREQRRAGVLVTVADVRGHAPRDAGAKMVVSAEASWGSVGGGNLEETALARARAMLDEGGRRPRAARPRPHRQGPHRPRPPVLRRRGHPAARAAAGGGVRGDLRRRPRRARARPHPGGPRPRPPPRRLPPGPARRRAPGAAGRRGGAGAGPPLAGPRAGARSGPGRHPRPGDDPRPRRGLRPLRRRPALHPPRLGRADRLGRQVGPLPHRPRGGGSRRGHDRPHPLPHRAARSLLQAAGRDRRLGGRRADGPPGRRPRAGPRDERCGGRLPGPRLRRPRRPVHHERRRPSATTTTSGSPSPTTG